MLNTETAIGLIILLYDHVLTFSDEVTLVWLAPPSFPKYAFIFNRYLVLACLIGIAHGEYFVIPPFADHDLDLWSCCTEMCGFVGNIVTDLVSAGDIVIHEVLNMSSRGMLKEIILGLL